MTGLLSRSQLLELERRRLTVKTYIAEHPKTPYTVRVIDDCGDVLAEAMAGDENAGALEAVTAALAANSTT